MDIIWPAPCYHFIEDDTKRVDIAADVNLIRIAPNLLGAHVGKCSLNCPYLGAYRCHGKVCLRDTGQSKIKNFDSRSLWPGPGIGFFEFSENNDISGLQVTMYDSALVGVGNGVADLTENGKPFTKLMRGKRTA